jgi:capsule polysaccharide export protein KpsE/RkpR
MDTYNGNVSTNKTEYETVQIKVMDHDPQRASDMCDSIITFYNQKVRQMHKAKDKEMVDISKRELERNYNELAKLSNKLDSVRESTGILSFNQQVDEVTRGYMNALASGRGSASDTKKIEQLYSSLSKKGTQAAHVENRFYETLHIIDSLTNIYHHYRIEYEKDITYSHVVEYPFPADKKAYPVRWLIVAFTTASAVFLGLLLFLVLDYRKP